MANFSTGAKLSLTLLDNSNLLGYTFNVIQSFKDKETEEIYNGTSSKKALRCLPKTLWGIAYRKFYALDNAILLKDLSAPPSNRLEALRGDRKGQHSIRINEQYRICFNWTSQGPVMVEIVDYH